MSVVSVVNTELAVVYVCYALYRQLEVKFDFNLSRYERPVESCLLVKHLTCWVHKVVS